MAGRLLRAYIRGMARPARILAIVLVLCCPALGQADSSAAADTARAVVRKPAAKALVVPRPKTNWSKIKELFM